MADYPEIRIPLTSERMDIFLKELAETGNFTGAARVASPYTANRHGGVSTFRDRVKVDLDFAIAVEEARKIGEKKAKSQFMSLIEENINKEKKKRQRRPSRKKVKRSSPKEYTVKEKKQKRKAREVLFSAYANPFTKENSFIIARKMVYGARKNAREYGRGCTIEPKDILPLPRKCPILGLDLSYGGTGIALENSASIDRIDNTIGYIPDNVVIISRRANSLKSDASPDELRRIADFYEKIVLDFQGQPVV